YGDQQMPLTVTRTDTGEAASSNFMIGIVMAPPGGLSVTDGTKVTSAEGAKSTVITVADTEIPANGTIVVEVPYLFTFLNSGVLTDANVVVTSNAATAAWTGKVAAIPGVDYSDYVTLTSSGGPTTVGENINVTFTGAGGNPWVPNTYGEQGMPLTVFRTDSAQTASIVFTIETAPPPGFIIGEGANITASDGATSEEFTIADSEVPADGTITIDISALNGFVMGGTLTDANIIMNDSAVNADWTGSVSDGILTMTSTGGPTAVNEAITLTFTGAESAPWIPNTHGIQVIPLTAYRADIMGPGRFAITIETAPPSGYSVAANFTAIPVMDMAPVNVSFTDASTGNATSWSWDFGDGGTSIDQNPFHAYTNVGTFSVTLIASNEYGSDTKIQWDYIHALNGAVLEAATGIDGLTITTTDGGQTVTIDASILPAALIPNSSVLEIQPPAGGGWKNITFYALDGTGFIQNGAIINGTITGVHLESEDIVPDLGFSEVIGTGSAFWYSMDLPSYPVDASLSTKIWEGSIPEYDVKLRKLADGNNAGVVGTAYTAVITKTNFPAYVPVSIHMSVGSGWNPSLSGGPGIVFIWRISDDGNSGQILPTTLLSTNPGVNLDYFVADSPSGMSTFGISSFTGNNNPFQMIALAAQEAVSQPSSSTGAGSSMGSGSSSGDASVFATPTVVTTIPVPDSPMGAADFAMITRVFTNPDGIISQGSSLKSTDGLVRVSFDLGVVARNSSGIPLDTVSIRRIPTGELPAIPADGDLSFAGTAYDLQPDGATFSPPISIFFTIPPNGTEFIVQQYDPASGTWTIVQSSYDAQTKTVVAQVSHLCTFALFAKTTGSMGPTPVATRISSSELAEKGLSKTALPISGSIMAFIGSNPLVSALIAILVVIGSVLGYTRLQARRKIRGVHHYSDEEGGSRASVDEDFEGKRQKAFAGIIDVLNDIDGQVHDLERAMKSRAPSFVFPADEAAPIVSRFFYSCQVAEERLKTAEHAGYITEKQVHDLNVQLDGAVQKMVELARQSETLNNFVLEKFGAQAGQ
ncbi:MAG: PKD domain-containing protein, partial [Methanomicrobiales archaeon]|nr:PKD domain-containing protein [Methanomicrobiales archaeon]